MVYKFRLWFEDDNDISRSFEIKPGNTFAEFHTAIQKSISFDFSYDGSFIISDDNWRQKQIVKDLVKTAVKDAVFVPYQKFIYIADEIQDWTLYCEMIGFGEAAAGDEYPKLLKTEGIAPKQRPSALIEDEETADMDDLADMLMNKTLTALNPEKTEDENQDTDEEPTKDNIFDEEFGTDEGDLDGFGEPSDM